MIVYNQVYSDDPEEPEKYVVVLHANLGDVSIKIDAKTNELIVSLKEGAECFFEGLGDQRSITLKAKSRKKAIQFLKQFYHTQKFLSDF